ncbi:hypothetical protein V6N11_028763 [Hibiscus sabdariffa]|uniref:RNase H type-1 domain-containing protein n=1 Tax=Hibiscus sabdariffa TaxID=183260 RepID=A0ABR2PQS7_9ROSI
MNRHIAWANYYHGSLTPLTPLPLSLHTSAPSWIAPASGWTCLNIDDVVSQSSHDCKIVGLIRNSTGEWLVGFAKAIGHSDILQAEIWAIYEGLILS